MRNTKIKKRIRSLVNGHIYIIMVILRSQNKNTDFFMILAWLSLQLCSREYCGAYNVSRRAVAPVYTF